MAILKIVKNPCDTDEALYNLCKYIAKEGRTCGYCGGRGLYPSTAYEEICRTQILWGKDKRRRAYHFIVGFEDGTVATAEEAMEVAVRISSLLFPPYQVLFGVHVTQKHIHIHFAVNPVSLVDGKKLAISFEFFRYLRDASNNLIEECTSIEI